jgi:hypothetical protein
MRVHDNAVAPDEIELIVGEGKLLQTCLLARKIAEIETFKVPRSARDVGRADIGCGDVSGAVGKNENGTTAIATASIETAFTHKGGMRIDAVGSKALTEETDEFFHCRLVIKRERLAENIIMLGFSIGLSIAHAAEATLF